MINRALDINFEEQFFEPEAEMEDDGKVEEAKEQEVVEQEDDLKEGDEVGR